MRKVRIHERISHLDIYDANCKKKQERTTGGKSEKKLGQAVSGNSCSLTEIHP